MPGFLFSRLAANIQVLMGDNKSMPCSRRLPRISLGSKSTGGLLSLLLINGKVDKTVPLQHALVFQNAFASRRRVLIAVDRHRSAPLLQQRVWLYENLAAN